ncbi:MAG: aminotransferase class V-fold PLP-dependent enzyme [Planctomycetaceae bacterium]
MTTPTSPPGCSPPATPARPSSTSPSTRRTARSTSAASKALSHHAPSSSPSACASNAGRHDQSRPAHRRPRPNRSALTWIDAVHYAPHGLIDIKAIGCDFLVCSAYKFFGPHVGIFWGRRDLLEQIQPYKLRPCANEIPGRWMTGTQNHEGIAGVTAAIDYIAEIGKAGQSTIGTRRDQLKSAFASIVQHERELGAKLIAGLQRFPGLKIWGITNPDRFHERVPTISVTHIVKSPRDLATQLAERGLCTWPGNHYALPLTETLALEPHGTLRIGLVHYNTAAEVDRLLSALAEIV